MRWSPPPDGARAFSPREHGCAVGEGGDPVTSTPNPTDRTETMAMISCPKCDKMTGQAGYAAWQIIVAICAFPLGLLSLLAGRKPTTCGNCGHTWQA